MEAKDIQIIAFYEFKRMRDVGELVDLRDALKQLFRELGVRGTIILAEEGYNGMVCGERSQIDLFVERANDLLQTSLVLKTSFHDKAPFRKIDIKIKPEIVTLKIDVDVALCKGTHITAKQWNSLVTDPDVLLLDARNDYEYRAGTFKGAVNPGVTRFSELPGYVDDTLDPKRHKRVAMFCTGGIRCEKFAPYLKQIGFEEVFQLEGGILRYLEETPQSESLWQGECFVFDERITVDNELRKGTTPDYSQRHNNDRQDLGETGS